MSSWVLANSVEMSFIHVYHFHKNETYFRQKKYCNRPRFETKAKGNIDRSLLEKEGPKSR